MPPKGSKKQPDGQFAIASTSQQVPGPPSGAVPTAAELFENSPEYHEAYVRYDQRMQALETNVRKTMEYQNTTGSWMMETTSTLDTYRSRLMEQEARFPALDAEVKMLFTSLQDLARQVQTIASPCAGERSASATSAGLVIRRLPETDGETPQNLEDLVLGLFGDSPMKKEKIVSIRRVGQRSPDRPRLVLVMFVDAASKLEVKRMGWKLAGKSISMDHALTPEQLKQRAAQWPLLRAAKEAGSRWGWSDSEPWKLIVWAKRPTAA